MSNTSISPSSLLTPHKTLTIALAGNPNSGKTSLFNALTNLRQKVANYPGVTVEKKVGRMILPVGSGKTQDVQIIDLPGTYSLAVRSPDEKVARDVLLGKMPNTPKPDLVVCVVDASNLERNLYLVTQIQDLGLPVIVALNMMDMMERQGKTIDVSKLVELLGVPIVPVIASQGRGIEDLKKAIVKGTPVSYRRHWRMPDILETHVDHLSQIIIQHEPGTQVTTAFSEAVILISKEDFKKEDLVVCDPQIQEAVLKAREVLNASEINWRSAAIEARYAWIQSILQETVKEPAVRRTHFSDVLDTILTDKIWGWVAFVAFMGIMFFMIFSVATYPMNWIDSIFSGLSNIIKDAMPAGDVRDLITDGVIAGVGGVVIFLPQILILFFFIGLLQDTGYMARAAFIMDRVMSRVGLHGKSFIPLLSSFACAIPGIMAARAIEHPKDRLVTILIAPLMSCSARLPVYTLLIATIIPVASAWQKAGIMLSMYLLGIAGAFAAALVLKKTLLKSATPVFIMELPPYRWPSLKTVLIQMWERSYLFLKRAGTVIFGLSIILWALMSYPKHEGVSPTEGLQKSFAGMAGQAIEPVIKPLGYDWRIGIGLIGSFAAREVFVSTMNIVFNVDNPDEETQPLRDSFREAKWPDGRPLFTPLACLSLMVFYVFAMQCLSTVAIVYRETNGWKWPLFQLIYMTAAAYILSLLVYQGGRWFGLQ